MTRDDRPKDPPPEAPDLEDDPDRAAILARRQRFVALALTGLATSCTPKSQPQPCLDVAPTQETPPPEPQPCLKVIAPQPEEQPGTQPQPDTAPGTDPQPTPAPCLKVAPPREPEPTPCLKVAPPPEPAPEPKPEPRPCLKVRR